MPASIVQFWSRLVDEVHPEDEPVLEAHTHEFNLRFPPPAYVGDVERAPIVLLYSNGGYQPEMTPREFVAPDAANRLREYLRDPTAIDPSVVSPWYGGRNFAGLIEAGRLVLINAVAYRSPRLSQEPVNQKVAKLLPSLRAANRWLEGEVLNRSDRLVLLHRGRSYWQVPNNHPRVMISPNPISSDLSADFLRTARSWKPAA